MQAFLFFFFLCPCQKGKSWSQEFLAKTVETGESRREESHEFYRLKALITLEQVITLVVEKKNDLNEQNFDGEANWSGVVNFHCMQMNFVLSMHGVTIFLSCFLDFRAFTTLRTESPSIFVEGESARRVCIYTRVLRRIRYKNINILKNTRPSIKVRVEVKNI